MQFAAAGGTSCKAVPSPTLVALFMDDDGASDDLLGFAIARKRCDADPPQRARFLLNALSFPAASAPPMELPVGHDAPVGFGKFASLTMLAVARDDAGYVAWCRRNTRGPAMARFVAFCAQYEAALRTWRMRLPPDAPSNVAPFQDFCWLDFGVDADCEYEYVVVPVRLARGSGARVMDAQSAVKMHVRTPPLGPVRFNMGVAGSRAYARKFGYAAAPSAEARAWLGNGMETLLLEFIARAHGDAHALYMAIYELSDPDVTAALKRASARGVAVHVVYDGTAARTLAYLAADADFAAACATCEPRPKRNGLMHNKFIVLACDGEPTAVLTGSANFTRGGLFGQHNVVHVLDDAALAGRYLAYWHKLRVSDGVKAFAQWNEAESPLQLARAPSVDVIFCPRKSTALLTWLAGLIAGAQSCVCVSAPFGVCKQFTAALLALHGPLKLLLLENAARLDAALSADASTLVSVGSVYAGEQTTGLNDHVLYCHAKLLLIDPLGQDPIVVAGSGNFSDAMCQKNDENVLVLRGRHAEARLYFCEFLRVWRHWRARMRLSHALSLDPTPAWTRPHFDPAEAKCQMRMALSPLEV